jgi:hypothetical protein
MVRTTGLHIIVEFKLPPQLIFEDPSSPIMDLRSTIQVSSSCQGPLKHAPDIKQKIVIRPLTFSVSPVKLDSLPDIFWNVKNHT